MTISAEQASYRLRFCFDVIDDNNSGDVSMKELLDNFRRAGIDAGLTDFISVSGCDIVLQHLVLGEQVLEFDAFVTLVLETHWVVQNKFPGLNPNPVLTLTRMQNDSTDPNLDGHRFEEGWD